MGTTMSSAFWDETLARAQQRLRAVEAAEMYMEYLTNDWTHTNSMPHCDVRVLHSPKTCKACDKFKPLQQYRQMLGLKFTDELQANDPLLPGEDRTKASAEAWGGNR